MLASDRAPVTPPAEPGVWWAWRTFAPLLHAPTRDAWSFGHALSEETWDAIEVEARDMLRLLSGRDGAVYRRFGHWWSRLPSVQMRVVPEA